jgi:hypothetical protein
MHQKEGKARVDPKALVLLLFFTKRLSAQRKELSVTHATYNFGTHTHVNVLPLEVPYHMSTWCH